MSFHQYRINEVYSNTDGSIQFIELTVGNFSGESFWSGQSITSSHTGGSNLFTFPGNLPADSTANTTVLLATQAFANLGIVTPNFIVPADFLFTTGEALNFAGVDNVTYAALPSDGMHSLTRTGEQLVATPKNFAGATGSLPAPPTPVQEPGLITGTPGNDTLTGTILSEVIDGLAGNDTFVSTAGRDTLDGGVGNTGGRDTVVYALARSAYTLARSGAGVFTIEKPNSAGSDTLLNIERLRFSDTNLALDLDGNAGTTAKLLGVTFGKASVANPLFAGVGLSLLDAGMSYPDLMQAAINARLGGPSSNSAVIDLLFTNLYGRAPSAGEMGSLLPYLDGGAVTQAGLGVLAADSGLNATNIGLVGLAQTGLEFGS